MMPKVMLRYSKDGGRNFSNWKLRDLGEIGKYRTRIRFNRLGQFVTMVIEIRVADPVRRDLISAKVGLEGEA